MGCPLVSIIVPVYNTKEYVEECIQSILSQSYKGIELIFVNDGSTDGPKEICKGYEHLPNVRYFEQENLGITVARRWCFSEEFFDSTPTCLCYMNMFEHKM